MGHANLSNLSDFFVNRLYAKGQLSLKEACECAAKAGQFLQASEGEYEDACSIAIGMMDVIHYLSLDNPARHGYSGPRGGGPWIVPALSVWDRVKRNKVSAAARAMLMEVEPHGSSEDHAAVTADLLIDEGFEDWAYWIRNLPLLRRVYHIWNQDDPDNGTASDYEDWAEVPYPGDDTWMAFDQIPWKFAPGVRKNYRDVPRLGNVTH